MNPNTDNSTSEPDTTLSTITQNQDTTIVTDTTVTDTTIVADTTVTDTTIGDTTANTTESDGGTTMPDTYKALNYSNMKALWMSQFDLSSIYCDSGAQRSESSYTTLIKAALSNCKSIGFNTIIVQMRPNADSMYPSDYYPPSIYVVGAYGNSFTYDPMEILIEEAHKLDLSVQAWINPLRGMTTTQINSINSKYTIRQWYSDSSKMGLYLVNVSNRLYLNPTYPEVRQLIIDGAAEILDKYDVDGLHMDDYFYPTTDASFDSAAYAAYKSAGGSLSLADYRRGEINKLVKGLYDMIQATEADAILGVSPAGNYDTTYNNLYADIKTWCGTEGYIDYICPQAYFGFEHQTYDFVKVVTYYNNLIKTDSVKLIIGMSLGKALNGSKGTGDTYAGTGKNEWIENTDVLKRCLEYTENLSHCSGVAYFCYQYFYTPGTNTQISGTATERANFVPILKTIVWTE